jgi:hypothetical protein
LFSSLLLASWVIFLLLLFFLLFLIFLRSQWLLSCKSFLWLVFRSSLIFEILFHEKSLKYYYYSLFIIKICIQALSSPKFSLPLKSFFTMFIAFPLILFPSINFLLDTLYNPSFLTNYSIDCMRSLAHQNMALWGCIHLFIFLKCGYLLCWLMKRMVCILSIALNVVNRGIVVIFSKPNLIHLENERKSNP